MTYGEREVEDKRRKWSKLDKKKRRKDMQECLFPAVLGPKRRFFILDHHHLALALLRESVDQVQVGVVRDLSMLEPAQFWIYLDHLSYVHPYDENGERRSLADIPNSFAGMRDDPYRSLAGAVRRAGGFAKSDAPFLEFLWSNHFRRHVARSKLTRHFRKAVRESVKLALSAQSSYLPGFCGER
jgi:hypothetical protein